MEQRIHDAIVKVCNEKTAGEIHPSYALLIRDIMPSLPGIQLKDAKTALWRLVKQEKVRWGRTINDTYFEYVREEKEGR